MNKNERVILKELVGWHEGELSPATLINGIAKGDEKSVQNLKSKGYIDTVPHPHRDLNGNYYDVPFYFATAKGLVEFEPWYKKIWFSFKRDLRTIIVTIIISVCTTLVTIFLGKLFK